MRFVPALSKFVAPFLVGRTTSDLVGEAETRPGREDSFPAGEGERLREVDGLPLPFFLKNGTLTCSSVDAIVVRVQEISTT